MMQYDTGGCGHTSNEDCVIVKGRKTLALAKASRISSLLHITNFRKKLDASNNVSVSYIVTSGGNK